MAKLSDWERDPDPTIYVLSSAQPVHTDAVRASITEWLDAAEVSQ